jgi:hydroxymethylbilane synthase
MRPDLQVEPVRGNVDTRLRKLKDKQFDALMLAAAGLKRLGFAGEISEILSAQQSCPAPGQGALGIQTRAGDVAQEICRALDHEDSHLAVDAERCVLAGLGGGCQLPLGAFAEKVDNIWTLTAIVMSPNGSRVLREHMVTRGGLLGVARQCVKSLRERGAAEILAAATA